MGNIKHSEISSLNFLAMPKAREDEHNFPSIFHQCKGFQVLWGKVSCGEINHCACRSVHPEAWHHLTRCKHVCASASGCNSYWRDFCCLAEWMQSWVLNSHRSFSLACLLQAVRQHQWSEGSSEVTCPSLLCMLWDLGSSCLRCSAGRCSFWSFPYWIEK